MCKLSGYDRVDNEPHIDFQLCKKAEKKADELAGEVLVKHVVCSKLITKWYGRRRTEEEWDDIMEIIEDMKLPKDAKKWVLLHHAPDPNDPLTKMVFEWVCSEIETPAFAPPSLRLVLGSPLLTLSSR